jgi:1-acyl-sn-glycerol-3-phosphate acyltransferase
MFLGAIGLPNSSKPLGKIELKKIPLLGYLFSVGAILVDRKSRESREKSIFRIRQEIKKGNNVFIYPEGTRNQTDKPLRDFYDGAFRFAIESNSPLVVMISINAKQIVPANGLYLRPGKIDLHYLPVYETKELNQNDIQQLKQQVYNDMETFILKHDPAFQK